MSGSSPRVAIITVARGRHEHLARQQAVVSALGWDVVRVVVSMDDPSLAAVTGQHPGVQTVTVPVADPGRLPLGRPATPVPRPRSVAAPSCWSSSTSTACRATACWRATRRPPETTPCCPAR